MTHELLVDGSFSTAAGRVVLDFGATSPGPIALALVLLRDGLVEAVALRTPHNEKVRLVFDPACGSVVARARAKESLELTVGPRELGCWAAFFLRYHRDGWAEVNHLDVEAVWDSDAECELVLRVPLARR